MSRSMMLKSYRIREKSMFVILVIEQQEGLAVVVRPETVARSIVACLWSLLCSGLSSPKACHLPSLLQLSVPAEEGSKAS